MPRTPLGSSRVLLASRLSGFDLIGVDLSHQWVNRSVDSLETVVPISSPTPVSGLDSTPDSPRDAESDRPVTPERETWIARTTLAL